MVECERCALQLCTRCRPRNRHQCASTGEDGESSDGAVPPAESVEEQTDSVSEGDEAAIQVADSAEGELPPFPENGVWLHVRGTVRKAKDGSDATAACGFVFATGMAERCHESWPPAAAWFLCRRAGCFGLRQ